MPIRTAYLVSDKFLPDLQRELQHIEKVHGNLVITQKPKQKTVWSQCIAENIQIMPIPSIGIAAKILREHGKKWAPYSVANHRRSQLIQDQLPTLKNPPLTFLETLPEKSCGLWSLLDKDTMLFSNQTNSPFPLGEIHFNENKETPPSRAYLKLWELMTVHGVIPAKGEKVIDFGSCPGGWTWVLQQVGCKVLSIDKAPLASVVAQLPGVEFIKADAFSLKPEDLGPVDWFFSDIICYPPKLLELVKIWSEKKLCSRFVCTIKFQGETDFETVQRFERELGARVIHLFHNKHEVTAIITP